MDTAYNVHEEFAKNLAYEKQIFWEAYTELQFPVFKQKLEQLFRDPEGDDSKKHKAECLAMEKVRNAVYNSTISQRKYTNKNLLATFVLVTVAEGTTFRQARDAKKFSMHFLIRTRKCMKQDDSTNCCMIFIDEHGRVYQNWKHFMENNLLPQGVALAPSDGVYTFEDDKLIIDSWETPASGLGHKAVATADVAAGVGGFAAVGVTLSALALPVAAPVLAGATVVCLGTGIYSAIRSGWQLWNRNEHEQSISVKDQSARACWIGVASGAVAVSSSVATQSLTRLARAGKEVSMVRQTVVNGMNMSTMLISGTGVANGICDLLLKDDELTGLDLLQVAASLALFTHSVYNFRLASTIVSQTQDAKLNAYRSELSNRQRKMFDKMTKESIRTSGGSKGKTDVIRLINEVPDKQYLNDLNRINRDLNRNNIRFTAGQDGHILLNDEIPVKADVLRANVQHGNGENILAKVTNPIPESHSTIQGRETVNSLTSNAFAENSRTLLNYCNVAFKGVGIMILNADGFQNCIQYLIKHVGEKITEFLITQANKFLDIYREKVEAFIRTKLYLDTVLWDLYKQCEKRLVNLTMENLEEQISKMFESLLDYYKNMSWQNESAKRVKCDVCQGVYQICSI